MYHYVQNEISATEISAQDLNSGSLSLVDHTYHRLGHHHETEEYDSLNVDTFDHAKSPPQGYD